jgi:3-methyladenine DNA glycosylase AlkC
MARTPKSRAKIEEAPVPAAPSRKGARTRADVPEAIRKQLNAGTLEAVTLVEVLVVDFAKLMRAVVPDLPAQQLKRLDPELGVTQRMATAGELLLEHAGETAFDTFRTHRSDTVRGWAAYALGRTPELSLEERLRRIRPLADDPNSGVREWAWISLRPHVSRDIERAIPLLRPWTAERTNIRRYAVEITRPRGVWCEHIGRLKETPELGLPLLNPLIEETEKYVQDSVANWLNGAAKSRGEWVREVCADWSARSEAKATERIVKRALRSL